MLRSGGGARVPWRGALVASIKWLVELRPREGLESGNTEVILITPIATLNLNFSSGFTNVTQQLPPTHPVQVQSGIVREDLTSWIDFERLREKRWRSLGRERESHVVCACIDGAMCPTDTHLESTRTQHTIMRGYIQHASNTMQRCDLVFVCPNK